MSRDKSYKSPSTRKRNGLRLIKHLQKMIRISRKMIMWETAGDGQIRRDNSDVQIGQSSDTRSHFWYSFDNFQLFTSTPKKKRTLCEECWKQCIQKHSLWNSYGYMDVTWQGHWTGCLNVFHVKALKVNVGKAIARKTTSGTLSPVLPVKIEESWKYMKKKVQEMLRSRERNTWEGLKFEGLRVRNRTRTAFKY